MKRKEYLTIINPIMYKYFIKSIFLALCLFVSSHSLQAQDLLKGKDLSQVKVDQLSDADIVKLKTQLTSAGMTIDQAEQMAIAKGMPASEFAKLKQRLSTTVNDTNKATGKLKSVDNKGLGRENNSSDTLDTDKRKTGRSRPLIDSLIFGSELYTSTAPSFEPNQKLATPLNYVLGPDDQISITVYGIQEYNGDLPITPEGAVFIPNVGQIKVAGLTVEAATQRIKNIMGNSTYPYLKNGGSKLTVTLSKIRSIKVIIVGAYLPGNYTLSSLSTVFNALFAAGGPSAFGSFREIELVRNNKVERTIDLYRFMLHGDQSDNVPLKDNDLIRIPPYKTRVRLEGQIKRPGIFEVLPGETFGDILSFASGFTDTAYRATVKVYQNNERERALHDLSSNAYKTYIPQTGDLFVVSKLLNRFQNRVRITGAVYRPDVYELSPGFRLADLIAKADGLREDAYTGRGQILRLDADLSRSIIAFDVSKAIKGDAANNPLLLREDEVLISAVADLRDSFKVIIQGEIRMPGQYDYVSNLSLKDLILQAGGFTDAAFKNIEIARLIKRDSIISTDNSASHIINTEINDDLSSPTANIPIQAFDVVTVRRKAGYTLPESVTVNGQVQYPGPYALGKRDERISDVLKRAGGYTPDAYPEGAFIRRYPTLLEKEKAERANEMTVKMRKAGDTSETGIHKMKDYDQIPLDLISITNHPGSIDDITLRSGDELYIPKFDAQVKVSNGVLLETQLPYNKSNNFTDYISGAGGYSRDAWKKGAYVVYANGKAATIKHFFFFFKSYPKVLPGSEIVVPKKLEKKGLSTGEIIGISSALASLAGVVIAILSL
jgi:protein involved in polysaccharide export with SLBB domain